jgi:aldehyde dehydrogenase (NAD+)
VFMNAGQTCLAWSRLLVPADRQDEAVDIARQLVDAHFPVGAPQSGSAVIGPVVSQAQYDRVTSCIRAAVDDGATVVTGGVDRPAGLDTGYYVAPTVLADVRPSHRVAQEEVFGPVLAIMPYDDADEAVALANGTIYGLHGAVFARDDREALEFANRLRTGQVDINGMQFNFMAPFGGYRQSGNGKELGVEGFESFLETKTFQIVRG